MKTQILIITLVTIASCQSNGGDSPKPAIRDTVVKHDTIYYGPLDDWQNGFGLTHDPELDSIWKKPVAYYLKNPKCDPTAKDFYLGEFRPLDNNTTAHLLSLATTDDMKLRPFYRWILNKTIIIQDGALAEYTGVPARLYAEKFPKEFFEYMDSDSTGQKYIDWTEAINYSGYLDNEDYKKGEQIRSKIVSKMKANCSNCLPSTKDRIAKFAKDCFK
jgi:hypothetical protein